jgi:uncharacterized membrane protein
MINVEYQTNLPVPADIAFAVMSDPARDPDWQGSCLSTRVLGATLGPGCRYEIAFQMLGKRMDFVAEIIEYEPGVASRFQVVEGPFQYIGSYRYHAQADGTTDLKWTFDAEPGGYFGVLPKSLLKKAVLAQVTKDLNNLSKMLSVAAQPAAHPIEGLMA